MVLLTKDDHRAVLSYYGIDFANMDSKRLHKASEELLAEKLCRCIKKVDPNDEKKSIAICRRSVLGRKGIDVYEFSCKSKEAIKSKNIGQSIRKTVRRHIKSKSNKQTKSSKY